MTAIVPMDRALLELASHSLRFFQYDKAVRILSRLIGRPELPPAIAAEANRLLAEAHFRRAEYEQARDRLEESLDRDPENAESHFLLAQTIEHEEEDEAQDALVHYEWAAALAPADARKRSAYGRRLAVEDADRGLAVLEETYQQHATDPVVVRDFVLALLESGRHDDAELLLAQAAYRHGDDRRIRGLRRLIQLRRWEDCAERAGHDREGRRPRPVPRGPGHDASRRHPRESERRAGTGSDSPRMRSSSRQRQHAGEAGPVLLPFRNFAGERPGDEREKKRSSRPRKNDAPAAKESDGLPLYDREMRLLEVLKLAGAGQVAVIYESLGLMGKVRTDHRRREISQALMQAPFVNAVVRELPAASRRVLRTLVRAGGFVPLGVLFQNTGPEAPPPDYVQPLIRNGLVYLGRDKKSKSKAGPPPVAMVPADLHLILAAVLRVPR